MKYKFRDLIEQNVNKNSELLYGPDLAIGVNIDKEIRVMKGDASGKDLSKFYIVSPQDFVYNPRGSRKLGLGFNDSEETYITTFNNVIFRIKEEARGLIDPTYLFMYMSRKEWDRKAEWLSWGSSTEVFSWETLCDTEIELPLLEMQERYSAVYKSLVANQKSYENGLEDLKLVCDATMDKFKNTQRTVPVGQLFKEVDERNTSGDITDAQGININKVFMPSKSTSADLANYKVVRKGRFAYSSMQTGRDEVIRIALYNKNEPAVISPAYQLLETTDEVLPEYLMMWFSRSESDRKGWFYSDGSVRASLELTRFFEIEVPLPPLEMQQSIVGIYNAYLTRREVNERLKSRLKDICPILISGSVKEAMKYE